MLQTNVIIKTSFSAIHRWKDCPLESVDYLTNYHRHVFHVTVKIRVHHNDRDVEFIDKKNEINDFLRAHWDGKNCGDTSCEQFAQALITQFGAEYVSVFEDDENGAEIFLVKE